MNIYVVRHGQTDLNKNKRLQGRNGLPLNSTGEEQANIAKEKLKDVEFDYVYSSPLARAIQTAKIIVPYIEPIIDDRINVFDVGEADNLPIDKIKMVFGVMPDPAVYKGVEDPEDYITRVYSFLDELKEKYKGKSVNILISGHRCTTGCARAYFEGMPEDRNFINLSSGNAEVRMYTI